MSAVQTPSRISIEDLQIYLAQAQSLKKGDDPSLVKQQIQEIDRSTLDGAMQQIYDQTVSIISSFAKEEAPPFKPCRVHKLDLDSDDDEEATPGLSPQEYVVVSPQEEALDSPKSSPGSSPKQKPVPAPLEEPHLNAPEDEVASNTLESKPRECGQFVREKKEELEGATVNPVKKERKALEVLKEIAERIVELIQIVFRSICSCFSKKSIATQEDTVISLYNSPASPRSPANSPRKVCVDLEKEENIDATSSSSSSVSIKKIDDSITERLPWCYTALGAVFLWERLKEGTISPQSNFTEIAGEITKKVEETFFTNNDASLEVLKKSVGGDDRRAQNTFYQDHITLKFNTLGSRLPFILMNPKILRGETREAISEATSQKIRLLFNTGKGGILGTFLRKQGMVSLAYDCQVFVILDYRSNTPHFYVGVKQGDAPLEITLKKSCDEVTAFLGGKLFFDGSFLIQDFYEEYVPNK